MWSTGENGYSTGRENEVGHTIRGEKGGGEEQREEEERRHLLKIPRLTFQFLMSPNHSFLDRVNSWKWFKGNI